ncbi:MAG: hypothetical protein JXX29_05845 [Deltaproteobacteria bacterium]|nr:hypothetical protein [Deltaproteobacteria bacterium]MBN2671172.1 hypothetical protein [Deltaproteobacteria bacterium]
MGSVSKELREKQLKAAVAEFEEIKASLKEKGLDDKALTKNTLYRQLKANVTAARRRIVAIDARAAHVEAMKGKETKAEKVAKEKKAAPAQVQQSNQNKTKKKKK